MISQKTVYVIWLIGFMVVFTACQSAPADIEPTMSMTRTPITTAVTPPPFASPTSTAIVTPTATLDLRTIGIYPTAVWTPDPSITLDTTNWLTYTDEEIGYTFKYPQEGLFFSGPVENKQAVLYGSFSSMRTDLADMVIVINENPSNLTAEQFLSNLYMEIMKVTAVPNEYLTEMKPITINGLPAIWAKSSPSSEVYITLVVPQRIFVFYATTHGEAGGYRPLSDGNRAIFFQMLRTFTFIPSQ